MNPRQQRQDHALQRLADRTGATISCHALDRAGELGFSLDDIYRCIDRPEQTYACPVRYGPDRRMYQRGSVSVVLHETTRTVITVLLRIEGVWQHGTDTRRTLLVARGRNNWSEHQGSGLFPSDVALMA